MNMNLVFIMGRLADAPKYYPSQDGDPKRDRCWARIAVNPPTKNENAKADFFPICAWGSRARVLAQYGKKGKVWGVRGSLKTNNKPRPDGTGYENYTEISVAEHVMGPDAKGVAQVTAGIAQPATAPVAAPVAQAAAPAFNPAQLAALQAQAAGYTPEQLAALAAQAAHASQAQAVAQPAAAPVAIPGVPGAHHPF